MADTTPRKPAAEPAAPPPGQPADAPPAGGSPGAAEVRGGRLADLAGPSALPAGVPYAIAREPLYIANPEAAAAPARAFNAGDRVPAELVEKFGWGELTDVPEWASAPPAPAPEKSEEQK